MKHKKCIAGFLTAVFVFGFSGISFGKMKVGVVEFEERNDIGLENAGKIIAELLAEGLVNVGEYEITERLLLHKVLQEQKLGITGIIDAKTAPEIGKIYGLQGIVTGSTMKLGKTISITARLINTQSGSVIAASTVKMERLKDMEKNVEILANEISGIKRERLKVIKEKKLKEKTRSGFFLSAANAFDNWRDEGNSCPCLGGGFFYHGKLLNFEFRAFPPVADYTEIAVLLGLNVTRSFGLNVGFGLIEAGMSERHDKNLRDGEEGVGADFTTIFFGVRWRPSHKVVINLCGGGIYAEINHHWDDTKERHEKNIKIKKFFTDSPTDNVFISFDYFFNDDWGIKWFFLETGGEGNYIDNLGLRKSLDYNVRVTGLAVTRSFSFGGW